MPSSDASELGDELAFLGRVVTVSRQQHHRALYFQRLRLAHRRMVEAHTCCKPSGLAPIGGAEAAVAAIERALHALPAPFALLRHQLAMTYFMPFALTCLASIGRAATLLAQLHAQVSTRATGRILRQNPEPPLLLALARKSDATTDLLVREFVAVAASPPAELPACRLGLREFVAAATLLPVELPACPPSASAVPAVAPPPQATGAPTAPTAPPAPIAPTAPTALGVGHDDDEDVGEALEWSLDHVGAVHSEAALSSMVVVHALDEALGAVHAFGAVHSEAPAATIAVLSATRLVEAVEAAAAEQAQDVAEMRAVEEPHAAHKASSLEAGDASASPFAPLLEDDTSDGVDEPLASHTSGEAAAGEVGGEAAGEVSGAGVPTPGEEQTARRAAHHPALDRRRKRRRSGEFARSPYRDLLARGSLLQQHMFNWFF
jgi:hypothetical protein